MSTTARLAKSAGDVGNVTLGNLHQFISVVGTPTNGIDLSQIRLSLLSWRLMHELQSITAALTLSLATAGILAADELDLNTVHSLDNLHREGSSYVATISPQKALLEALQQLTHIAQNLASAA